MAAEIGRDTHAAKATELKAQLEQMKEEDDATERRLKAALDAVEAREASSRETGNRLVRRSRIPSASATRCRPSATPALPQRSKPSTPRALNSKRCAASMPSCSAILRRIPPITRCAPASFRCRSPTRPMPCAKPRKMSRTSPPILSTRSRPPSTPVEQAQAPIADAKRAHQP